ncbi:hypothetical protein Dtox_3012 [Desulfofarcimen acetoxidans DSM 771]|uniref:Spore coat associated protein JA (CotJA) n=1 Tax=Desulfofarcimen acetoxidans (strain ATCC 49208 / DSM 771 / KCTC 5769 / VKM B-1644 / 5575) TaxID=485916 RepID=C8W3H8_DESAS|nr:spore coat associated protein CotJA [Desulfofarcimen acetoxidans]ACV63764.1 hypothetical protein Dtox_3012 [Desulfofarcimen acetoxidans DSM 771]
MKQTFIPFFMRNPKMPPRPNKKVNTQPVKPVEETKKLNYINYPGDIHGGCGHEHDKFYYPEDNMKEHDYYHHPAKEPDDCLEDKDCMHKPGEDNMMPDRCPLAKSFVCWQSYGKVFNPSEALRMGTIFPEFIK